MLELGGLLYVVFAMISFYMWWQIQEMDLSKIMQAQNRHHKRVHRVLTKHPHGGDWTQYKKWMRGRV